MLCAHDSNGLQKPRRFAHTGWRGHNLTVLNVRRMVFWQAVAVVCAIALALALSRFFPVVGFVATLQVMGISLCFPTNPEVVGRRHD